MSRHVLLIAFVALNICAQTDSSPHFDVVSIKPTTGIAAFTGSIDEGHITYGSATLITLINDAYNLRPGQVTGPDWLSIDYFSVSATFPPRTTKEVFRQMMINMLAERFGLVTHKVTKEVAGYELVVAPGGPSPKLTASTGAPPPPPSAPAVAGPPERVGVDPEGFPVLTPNQIWASTNGDGKQRFTFRRRTMPAFAADLRLTLSRLSPDDAVIPVEDKTGLAGPFDFHLEIPAGPQRLPPALRMRTGQTTTSDDAPPVGAKEVSAALEKQLGLKLNPVKVPLDYIVVDKINKVPTDN